MKPSTANARSQPWPDKQRLEALLSCPWSLRDHTAATVALRVTAILMSDQALAHRVLRGQGERGVPTAQPQRAYPVQGCLQGQFHLSKHLSPSSSLPKNHLISRGSSLGGTVPGRDTWAAHQPYRTEKTVGSGLAQVLPDYAVRLTSPASYGSRRS